MTNKDIAKPTTSRLSAKQSWALWNDVKRGEVIDGSYRVLPPLIAAVRPDDPLVTYKRAVDGRNIEFVPSTPKSEHSVNRHALPVHPPEDHTSQCDLRL